MPWSIAAIQHEFLDTTGELVERLNDVPDDKVPDNGYQGQLKPSIINKATRRLINYLDASLTA